jgi:ribosome modulation factor
MKSKDRIERDGAAAYRAGRDMSTCPYDKGNDNRKLWCYGYLDAKIHNEKKHIWVKYGIIYSTL